MAIRTTDSGNRMINEAVLLTATLRERLSQQTEIRTGMQTGGDDVGVMAATLASSLISTFGKSMFGSTLFEEVDDADLPPVGMTAPPVGPAAARQPGH